MSLPPFIPFILYASSKIGQFVLGVKYEYTLEEMTQNFEAMQHLKTYIVGSFTLATISAVVVGFVGFLFFSMLGNKKIVVKDA